LPEAVALIALAAMPFFSFFVAELTGAPVLDQYSISTATGFGCLLGIVTAKRPPVGLGVLLFLMAQIGTNLFEYAQAATVSEPSTSIALSTRADEFADKYQMMEAVPNKNSPWPPGWFTLCTRILTSLVKATFVCSGSVWLPVASRDCRVSFHRATGGG
jgi:hypothetical protein